MQQPTIGRRLYFFCTIPAAQSYGITLLDPEQPCDAGVLFVHPDGTVNVQVTDHIGYILPFEFVPLIEDSEDHGHEYWVEWMPYQVKAEAEREAKVTPHAEDLGEADPKAPGELS